MTTRMVPIPKGAMFTITKGIYSDYNVIGIFHALKEIDAEALREEWRKNHPTQRNYEFDASEFIAWLSKLCLIEQIESWEFHLEDYGTIENMFVLEKGMKNE